jgi:phosphate transport system protein
MRDAFHHGLDELTTKLVELTQLVGTAMSRATASLLESDPSLARSVVADDDLIDARRAELDEHAVAILAQQQPVATDLRIVVTAMRMASDLERMGDLARHVADVTLLREPKPAVPQELHSTIAQMGYAAKRLVGKTAQVIRSNDVDAGLELERDDDEMDALQRHLYAALLAPDFAGGVEQAVDLALLGRYYERYADHAVSIARRVVYLVTGHYQRPVDA